MSGWIAAAATVASVGGAYLSGQEKADAAEKAAGAQQNAYEQGMISNRNGLKDIKSTMSPWIQLGTLAMDRQKQLLGLGTQEQEQQRINEIQNSPQFNAMFQQGENAILQNASATGGLRGGNIQAALAMFRPSVLSNIINQRLAQYGALSNQGQQASGLISQAIQNSTNNDINAAQGIGAAQAGAFAAQGAANAAPFGAISDLGSTYLGGFLSAKGKENASQK